MATELDGEELESISSQVEVLRKHLEVGWRSQTQCRSEKGKKNRKIKQNSSVLGSCFVHDFPARSVNIFPRRTYCHS